MLQLQPSRPLHKSVRARHALEDRAGDVVYDTRSPATHKDPNLPAASNHNSRIRITRIKPADGHYVHHGLYPGKLVEGGERTRPHILIKINNKRINVIDSGMVGCMKV